MFITRQPLFDANTHVAGYTVTGDTLDTELFFARLADLGLDRLSRSLPVLLDLRADTDQYLPAWPFSTQARVGVIVPAACVRATAPLPPARLPYARRAACVCVDDFHHFADNLALIDLTAAQCVRGDTRELSPQRCTSLFAELHRQKTAVIVRSIDTQDALDFYRACGADYFQGTFLAVPRRLRSLTPASDVSRALTLLQALQRPHTTLEEMEQIIGHDANLSYRLLRYLNSAAMGLRREFTSVRQALIYLGRQPLRRWASLLLAVSVADQPDELRRQALLRARLCERLAEDAAEADTGAYFTVGLFSLLDALLGRPMDEVLAALPLEASVKQALAAGTGHLGETLQCVRDHEQAHWGRQRYLGLGAERITRAYGEAAAWADAMIGALDTA